MQTNESFVCARIDKDTKQRAAAVLNEMGLSVSDAIRFFMIRVADEQRLPFEIKLPNKATQTAINELESQRGESFKSVDALLTDLIENN